MKKVIEVDKKIVNLFYEDINYHNNVPVIVLNTYDEDGEDIFNKVNNKEFILVSISNIDWNSEMSPWYMDRLFKGEDDYSGGADKYIDTLEKIIIPEINNTINNLFNINTNNYIIGGYSLAGLFAIYSLYKTDIFKSAISCSGSLWYPNFYEYVVNNDLKVIPKKNYFSLGNRESNTKNILMSTVKKKTLLIEEYFKNKNIDTVYEENEGNHFQNVTVRIVKGITWMLK